MNVAVAAVRAGCMAYLLAITVLMLLEMPCIRRIGKGSKTSDLRELAKKKKK